MKTVDHVFRRAVTRDHPVAARAEGIHIRDGTATSFLRGETFTGLTTTSAAGMGTLLGERLERLGALPMVGEARGIGLDPKRTHHGSVGGDKR